MKYQNNRGKICIVSGCNEKARIKAEAAEAIATAKAEAEKQAKSDAEAIRKIEQQLKTQIEEKAKQAQQAPAKTATCDCCGRQDIPESDMVKIDSGQMFCPECLKELRG